MYELFCAVISIFFVIAVPVYILFPVLTYLGEWGGGNKKSVLSGDLNDPNHRP